MATALEQRPQTTAAEQPTRWRMSVEQYHQLGRLGFFGDQRVELIGGEVYMTPIGPEHGASVDKFNVRLTPQFVGKGYYLRVQSPLRIGDSEPVPDLAIVQGSPSDYWTEHPTTALLVIEVSDTTLAFERLHKGSLYASANIPEYWIVNLTERVLEVYREPAPMDEMPFKAGYKLFRRTTLDETISPLFDPELKIPVKELFE